MRRVGVAFGAFTASLSLLFAQASGDTSPAQAIVAPPAVAPYATGTPTPTPTVTPGPTPTPTPPPCDDEWHRIDTDDRRSDHWLSGVAVASADRVWGAGTDYSGNTWERSLVRRWNGRRWRREDTPSVRGNATILSDIDVGRGGVFAVGQHSRTVSRTFVIRRRPGGGWRRMDSADPSASLNALDHVSVLSGRRAWAVGTRWDASGNHLVLVERWNGRRWSVASVGMNGLLHGVHARTAKDVWAVGRTVRRGLLRTLILHFNGRRWKQVPSPNVNDRPHILNAVHAAGPNDAWAVGYHYGDVPIAMHWNGTRWRLVDLPDLGGRSEAELRGVSSWGDEVVAVGYVSTPRDGFEALILEWNGQRFVQEDVNRFEDSTHLEDVEHAGNGSVFAAGYRSTGGGSEVVLRRPPSCS
ncbi:MAG: hypothetical protein M3N53_01270 [Actinomycetota bacterium]|nr:hypothetical protein [Actinomycetota bacterium]